MNQEQTYFTDEELELEPDACTNCGSYFISDRHWKKGLEASPFRNSKPAPQRCVRCLDV